MMPRTFVALAAMLLASCQQASPKIDIGDAWARQSMAGQNRSAAYLTIRNSGGSDRLLSVSAEAADASLHSTSMEDGIMRMRPLDSLDVPANSTVELKAGGTHIMLTHLTAPLEPGQSVDLKLRFERSGEREVKAEVRPSSAGAGM